MAGTEDVIDDFLVWELCKQQNIHKRIIEDSSDRKELKEEIVEKVKEEYLEEDYSLEEKMERLTELDDNPEYRSKILDEHSWNRENVNLEDLGTTLPRLGDLPGEVIAGSLLEVVKFVKEADPEKYRSVKYIESLKEVSEILHEFYPWVITPGNRPSKLDRMNRVHGEKDWDIEDTWGMINDGNHRTIAKILANESEEIECYVGRPIDNY